MTDVSAVGLPRRRILIAIVTTLALLAGLGSVPKAAHADTTECDRSGVLMAWQTGGSQVRTAAEAALLGSDADVCAFLATGWQQRTTVDTRVRVDQMMAAGGPSLRASAQTALDSTDPSALDTFLASGWSTPAGIDQRVSVNQMMAAGGAQLRSAAQKALDSTDPQALSTFLQSGWQSPYTVDQRIRVNQIMAAGGPEVKTAAQRALDAGDAASLSRFIDTDWPVAAARDQETAQVADLVSMAVDAGNIAAQQTQAAKDESARAVAAAAAAKQEAADAAAAAQRAQGDANAAAAAARRAAVAAQNAAVAAQQAIRAAAAASAAARVAANAATRAAAAAAKTSQSASWAYNAATSAALDARWTDGAHAAALAARDMAAKAKTAAVAAGKAGDAARDAALAATGAQAVASDAAASAQWALDAANSAKQAVNDANQARQAAATAAADASRANRAATAAIAFANQAAAAAYQSRDAANRAAADATAAATAADAAAADAGTAVDAAQKATVHANAALVAAQASVSAAQQAQAVYTAARTADSDQLEITFEQSDAAAQQMSAAAQAQQASARWAAAQAAKRSAETNQLIAEASDPATPHDQAVADARQVALTLAESDGVWTSAAAQTALAGDETALLDWVRNGISDAAGQDDRVTLGALMMDGTDGMRTAATAALNGSDADVAAFLSTEDYPGRVTDDRVAVNQVVANARTNGEATVVQRGQQALDDGSDLALRAFLNTGQRDAAAADERVKVNQILADPNSGPELKDAAQVALDGPPQFLGQFLAVGQYQAAQHDYDRDSHNATVLSLLVVANEAANTAMQNAYNAEAAAATARAAAAEAVSYAQQAAQSASQAAGYAQQAQNSAAQAQASAQQAAASAQTAVAAAKSANQSASNAAASAVWAQVSARHAVSGANEAYEAYQRAYRDAIAAGKSADEAVAAAKQARDIAQNMIQQEQADWAYEQAANCDGPVVDRDTCIHNIIRTVQNPVLQIYINGGLCQLLYSPYDTAKSPDDTGPNPYKDCIYDVLSPTFGEDQAAEVAQLITNTALQLTVVELDTVVLLGTAELCGGVCGALLEAAAPVLAPELIGLPTVGLDLFAGGVVDAGLTAMLDEALIDSRVDEATLAKLAEDLQLGCGANSFMPDTRVLLASGGSRPIKDIRDGDRVLSTDPVTGATDGEPVTRLITGTGDKQLVDVTIRSGGGQATVTATANHPFWVPDLARWVDAGELHHGQLLRTSTGTWAQVSAVRHHIEHATVNNLTVAGHHTFYVLAGATPLLVHNDAKCPENLALGIAKQGLQAWAERNGYTHYVGPEWTKAEDKTAWMGPVQLGIENAGTTLRVRLNGFSGATPLEMFTKAALNGAVNGRDGFGTELEMAWIARAVYNKKRTWDSVKFYIGDTEVTVPEPDLWNLVTGDSADAKSLRKTWQRWLNRAQWMDENGS
jgi:hypothetical protein